ncbi:MAG: hypothetical protein K6T80_06975 [Firmicutes bacterium]|nr:hypothetical protein [Bacillota bacterium]
MKMYFAIMFLLDIVLGICLTICIPSSIFIHFHLMVAVLWVATSFIATFLSGGNQKRKGIIAESVVAVTVYVTALVVSTPLAGYLKYFFVFTTSIYFRFFAILLVTSGIHLLLASIIELRKARTAILVTTGPYSFVRHPQHLAILIIVFGSFLPVFFPASLVNCLAFFLWFRKAGRIEEDLFLRDPAISAKYKVYQARVPSLFPLKTKKPGNGARLNL